MAQSSSSRALRTGQMLVRGLFILNLILGILLILNVLGAGWIFLHIFIGLIVVGTILYLVTLPALAIVRGPMIGAGVVAILAGIVGYLQLSVLPPFLGAILHVLLILTMIGLVEAMIARARRQPGG